LEEKKFENFNISENNIVSGQIGQRYSGIGLVVKGAQK
jgi:hypothetical protein